MLVVMNETKKNASFKELDLGPTGETVARNVARFRDLRGLTYAELSTHLSNLEHEIPPIGLRRIEAFARRVTVDDLMALSAALNVSPIKILFPPSGEPARTGTAIPADVTLDEAIAWANDQTNLEPGARLSYWQTEAAHALLEAEGLEARLAALESRDEPPSKLREMAITHLERQIERAKQREKEADERAKILQLEIIAMAESHER